MKVKVSLVICSMAAIALLMPVRAHAQASLAAARQLYASAEYTDALTMLNGLLAANPAGEERQSIELYRALCLTAVGNSTEAGRAIETMITRDPLYRPNTEEIPPRLRSQFSDARKKLLPSIIQQKYVVAKGAFDQQDFTAAAEGFIQVLNGLSDPDIAPVAEKPPLSDLRLLAVGFRDLAAKSIAPPPPAPAAAAAPAPVIPVDTTPRIYTVADRNVVQPVTVRQAMPPFPGKVQFASVAVIEVVVDTTGAVESVTLETPLNPQYNRMAIAAAKAWQYQPATLNGMPVKFRKRVQVNLVASR